MAGNECITTGEECNCGSSTCGILKTDAQNRNQQQQQRRQLRGERRLSEPTSAVRREEGVDVEEGQHRAPTHMRHCRGADAGKKKMGGSLPSLLQTSPCADLFESFCPTSVYSAGEDDAGGKKYRGMAMAPAAEGHIAADERDTLRPKHLPKCVASPSSFSLKCTPNTWRLHHHHHYHHHHDAVCTHHCHHQQGNPHFSEDDISVFRGLAAIDCRSDSNNCSCCCNYDDVDEGYGEESLMVCPFQLMGSCFKGQHTQRELLSNHTIHAHLMSLAGLVHELRTEQHVAQKEFEMLHRTVEAQRGMIERLEKRISAEGAATEVLQPVANASFTEMGSETAQGRDSTRTGNTVTPQFILKTALDGETDAAATGSRGGRSDNGTAERMRYRCAPCPRSNPHIVPAPSEVKIAAVLAEEREILEDTDCTPRAAGAKRLSEEVQTPVEMSHVVLDSSHANASRTESAMCSVRYNSHAVKRKKRQRKRELLRCREGDAERHHKRCDGTRDTVDNSQGDIVSPISTGGSRDVEVSSNEDVIMAMVTSRLHAPNWHHTSAPSSSPPFPHPRPSDAHGTHNGLLVKRGEH